MHNLQDIAENCFFINKKEALIPTKRIFRVCVCGSEVEAIKTYMHAVADSVSYLTFLAQGQESIAQILAMKSGLFTNEADLYLENITNTNTPNIFNIRFDKLNTDIILDASLYFDESSLITNAATINHLIGADCSLIVGGDEKPDLALSLDAKAFDKLKWSEKFALTNCSQFVQSFGVSKDWWKEIETAQNVSNYKSIAGRILLPLVKACLYLNDVYPCEQSTIDYTLNHLTKRSNMVINKFKSKTQITDLESDILDLIKHNPGVAKAI